MRRLLLSITVLWTIGIHVTSSSSIEIAMPDLAGMLYPASTQEQVVFGRSDLASLFASRLTTTTEQQMTQCAQLFCLHLAISSVYESDPFVLAQYRSKYPIVSPTFDALTASLVRPLVEGSADGDAEKAIWTFGTDYTLASSTNAPIIDLVLGFQRQSQQRSSMADQFLVHIDAELKSATSARVAVHSYRSFGKQRVSHKVMRISARVLQLNVVISGTGDLAPTQLVTETYPPIYAPPATSAASSTWKLTASTTDCVTCTALLLGCTTDKVLDGSCSFETSTAPFVTCLKTTAQMDTAYFANVVASNAIDYKEALKTTLNTCLMELPIVARV